MATDIEVSQREALHVRSAILILVESFDWRRHGAGDLIVDRLKRSVVPPLHPHRAPSPGATGPGQTGSEARQPGTPADVPAAGRPSQPVTPCASCRHPTNLASPCSSTADAAASRPSDGSNAADQGRWACSAARPRRRGSGALPEPTPPASPQAPIPLASTMVALSRSTTRTSAPVRSAPVKSAPVKVASRRFAPRRFAPLKFAPRSSAPPRSAPARCASLRNAPVRSASPSCASARCASLRSVAARTALYKYAWLRSALARCAPLRGSGT